MEPQCTVRATRPTTVTVHLLTVQVIQLTIVMVSLPTALVVRLTTAIAANIFYEDWLVFCKYRGNCRLPTP